MSLAHASHYGPAPHVFADVLWRLTTLLADGAPHDARTVMTDLQAEGCRPATITRAKHALGVRSVKQAGHNTGWDWIIPLRPDWRKYYYGSHQGASLYPCREYWLTTEGYFHNMGVFPQDGGGQECLTSYPLPHYPPCGDASLPTLRPYRRERATRCNSKG